MSWKCKIGLHDWETVDYVSSRAQLVEDVRAELAREPGKPKWPGLRVICDGAPRIIDRVCLRCSKADLNIERTKNEILDEMVNRETREQERDRIMRNHVGRPF